MKHSITQIFSELLSHRRLLTVLLIMVLVAIATVIYIAMTVKVSDLRVITTYTAYGVTHFYRDTWTYLLSFIAVAIITTIFTAGICLKLLREDRESLALLFGWIGIGTLCFILLTYLHIAELV